MAEKKSVTDAQILSCNGDPDDPTISGPDADLISFGRAVLALVDDPHKVEREAHFALQDRMFFQSEDIRVRALQAAIEGELEGLGISNVQAEVILGYVDRVEPPVAFRLVSPSGTSAQLTDDAGLAGDLLNRGWAVQPLVAVCSAERPGIKASAAIWEPCNPVCAEGYKSERFCAGTCRPKAKRTDSNPQPKAWAVFAENRNLRIWSTDGEGLRKYAAEHNLPLTPLYAEPTARAISDREIEQIAGTDELTGDAILRFAHRLLEASVNPRPGGESS